MCLTIFNWIWYFVWVYELCAQCCVCVFDCGLHFDLFLLLCVYVVYVRFVKSCIFTCCFVCVLTLLCVCVALISMNIYVLLHFVICIVMLFVYIYIVVWSLCILFKLFVFVCVDLMLLVALFFFCFGGVMTCYVMCCVY